MLKTRCRWLFLAFLVIQFQLCPEAYAAFSIDIMSGNGTIGGYDSIVQVQGAELQNFFEPENSGSSGFALQNAYIDSALDGNWVTAGINALWVSPGGLYAPEGGYEYFTSFNLPSNFTSVHLDVLYRADDLGMVQINRNNLLNTWPSYSGPGGFINSVPYSYSGDITNLFNAGENIFGISVINCYTGSANPTGVQFMAAINYEITPVPIPPAFLLMGSGLVGLIGIKRYS